MNKEFFFKEHKELQLSNFSVAIFGAGNTSLLYNRCFEKELLCDYVFLDNDANKQQSLYFGKQVFSPSKWLSSTTPKPKLVFVSSANIKVCKLIKAELSAYDCKILTIDEYVFSKRENEILEVMDSLSDEVSKKTYWELIGARANNLHISTDIFTPNAYFSVPEFMDHNANEVFVDCGAYVGDSVEEYIKTKSGVFSKIYAFEPESNNHQAFLYRKQRLHNEWAISQERIILEKAGVGARTNKVYFIENQSDNAKGEGALGASFINKGENQEANMQIYALDDYFKNQKVGFIKADIESYELDMLKGAKNIIGRDQPLLAICIYHNASDMYEIPLWLMHNFPNYEFKIRHHLYLLSETVLYAYPKS